MVDTEDFCGRSAHLPVVQDRKRYRPARHSKTDNTAFGAVGNAGRPPLPILILTHNRSCFIVCLTQSSSYHKRYTPSMSPLEAVIIAIVEGFTEFLPISSTGHMILIQSLLGLKSSDFTKVFIVNIQFGAILSVIVLYRRRFLQSFDFYMKLLIAFIPAAIIGFLCIEYIDRLLESVVVVAVTMLLGGVILLFVDRWFKNPSQDQSITRKQALIIGFFQCLAMIPGVSRSAATIIGGMSQKLDRSTAAEFSFFLAVPTMFAASSYKLLKSYQTITSDAIGLLVLGNVVAFLVAMIAIKSFIAYLTKHGFRIFGWYRIVLGLIILTLQAFGCKFSIN